MWMMPVAVKHQWINRFARCADPRRGGATRARELIRRPRTPRCDARCGVGGGVGRSRGSLVRGGGGFSLYPRRSPSASPKANMRSAFAPSLCPALRPVGGAQPQRTQHKPSRAAEPEGSSSQGMARVPPLDARMDREVAVETSPRRKSRRVAAIPFDRLLLLTPPHPPILSMRFTRRCRDNDADVVAQPVGGLWMQHGRPGR